MNCIVQQTKVTHSFLNGNLEVSIIYLESAQRLNHKQADHPLDSGDGSLDGVLFDRPWTVIW